ncbi:MAG: hypothetical protein B6243_06315 [Anaerolineaceae bacterium 4572_5.2]|nr:MAG: hypothetical protein B6243_06315 [Anaerolineaceae bacterium 4572_5.2]
MADKNGKQHGGYTRVLNEFLDLYMPMMSGSEFKMLMFLLRKTVGWNRRSDHISISQVVRGAGVGKRTAVRAAKGFGNWPPYFSTTTPNGTTKRFTAGDTLFSASEPYTRFPNRIIDELTPTLTGAEFKMVQCGFEG